MRRITRIIAATANGFQTDAHADSHLEAIAVKVPQVTLTFWIVKVLATTLGETRGDAVTTSWLDKTIRRLYSVVRMRFYFGHFILI